MTSARSRLQTHTAARSSPCRSHHSLSFFLSALVASKPTAVFVLLPKLNYSQKSPFAAHRLLARFSRPQKADPVCPSPVSLPAESPLVLLLSAFLEARLLNSVLSVSFSAESPFPFLLASKPQHASKPTAVFVLLFRITTVFFFVRSLRSHWLLPLYEADKLLPPAPPPSPGHSPSANWAGPIVRRGEEE